MPRKQPKGIAAKWLKVIRRIPGYDSVATAGECWFDAKAAERAIRFFEECLTHVKGEKAGSGDKPPQAFLLDPWEQAIVANIFGWKRPDGSRRDRKSVV